MPQSVEYLIKEILQIVEEDKNYTYHMMQYDLTRLLDDYTDSIMDATERDATERYESDKNYW